MRQTISEHTLTRISHSIEITDDYIAWSKKEMDQMEYQRISRAIVPIAAIRSTWASARYLVEVQLNKLRELFGLEPKWNSQVRALQGAIRMAEAKHRFDEVKRISASQKPGEIQEIRDSSQRHESAPNSDLSKKPGSSIPSSIDKSKVSLQDLQPPAESPAEKKHPMALILFMSLMGRYKQPLQVEPPKGSVIFTGLVEVIGTKSNATLDMTVAYDPQKREIVLWDWRPRRMQARRQRPKGGP